MYYFWSSTARVSVFMVCSSSPFLPRRVTVISVLLLILVMSAEWAKIYT